jgi:hypothetical protein
LFGCLVILIGATLVAATVMHIAERHIQPEKFGTIPDAMWWAIVTLGTAEMPCLAYSEEISNLSKLHDDLPRRAAAVDHGRGSAARTRCQLLRPILSALLAGTRRLIAALLWQQNIGNRPIR